MENFARIEALRRSLKQDALGYFPDPMFRTQEEFSNWECDVLKNIKAFDIHSALEFSAAADKATLGKFPLSASDPLFLKMKKIIRRIISEYEEKCFEESPAKPKSITHVSGIYSVFISYRRIKSLYTSRLIHDKLTDRGVNCFLDVENLEGGRFEGEILREIGERSNFVVIIEPGTLDRCSDSSDWLRREFECAYSHDRNIVPVFAETIQISEIRPQLPESMKNLTEFNGLHLSQRYIFASIDRLLTLLKPCPQKR